MVPFCMFLKLCFFESPLCFSLCAQQDLDIFFFSLPLLHSIPLFSFSVLSFSLFLDVLFNFPCLQEKTKKCFSLSISQAKKLFVEKKGLSSFRQKWCFHPFFLHSFLRINVFVSFFNTSFCLPFLNIFSSSLCFSSCSSPLVCLRFPCFHFVLFFLKTCFLLFPLSFLLGAIRFLFLNIICRFLHLQFFFDFLNFKKPFVLKSLIVFFDS